MAAEPAEVDANFSNLDKRRAKVVRLVQQLAWQLRHGCGNEISCQTPTCFTYRMRQNVGGAPLRTYTVSSAASLAIILAERQGAFKMVCPYLPNESIAQQSSISWQPHPQGIDAKSLVQQVAVTSTMKRFLDGCGPATAGLASQADQHTIDMPECVRSRQRWMTVDDLLRIVDVLRQCERTQPQKAKTEIIDHIRWIFTGVETLSDSFEEIHDTGNGVDTTGPTASKRLTDATQAIILELGIPLHQYLKRCIDRCDTDAIDIYRVSAVCLHVCGILPVSQDHKHNETNAAGRNNSQRNFPDLLASVAGLLLRDRQDESSGDYYATSLSAKARIAACQEQDVTSCQLISLIIAYVERGSGRAASGEWYRAMHAAFLHVWDGHVLINTQDEAGRVLELIEKLSMLDGHKFFNRPVFEHIKMESACELWLAHKPVDGQRHILSYHCLFPRSVHWQIFRTCCHLRMQSAVRAATFVSYARARVFAEQTSKHGRYLDRRLKVAQEAYLVLKVSRERLLDDAFDQLWQRESRELHKPLRVRMGADEGEIGHDLGGVQIEFFNLLSRQIFDDGGPFFQAFEGDQLFWLKPCSLEPLYRYELLGILMGLAVYNGITLPISLPLLFYERLAGGKRVEMDKLSKDWRGLLENLQKVADYDGDVESDLALDRSFTLRANGLELFVDASSYRWHYDKTEKGHGSARVFAVIAERHHKVENSGKTVATRGPSEEVDVESLDWPGWRFTRADADEEMGSVTNENRDEHVRQYRSWLLDYSTRPQFYALARGFYEVVDPRAMQVLPAAHLQVLVEGRKHINVDDLANRATYEGYNERSQEIEWFWRIVRGYGQNGLQSLLEFVTGSRRMPASGQQSLRFCIMSTDAEGEPLPGSSTCFGNLLLPAYKSEKIMGRKLAIALEHSIGFGQA